MQSWIQHLPIIIILIFNIIIIIIIITLLHEIVATCLFHDFDVHLFCNT